MAFELLVEVCKCSGEAYARYAAIKCFCFYSYLLTNLDCTTAWGKVLNSMNFFHPIDVDAPFFWIFLKPEGNIVIITVI